MPKETNAAASSAAASSSSSAFFQPSKQDKVKQLKQLITKSDTVKIRELIFNDPELLLLTSKNDSQETTTGYQDALADPFKEKAQRVFEEAFSKHGMEKEMAEQAYHFMSDDGFKKTREKQSQIMKFTDFAYNTYMQKYKAWDDKDFWDESDYVNEGDRELDIALRQAVVDAAIRVELAQNQWSEALCKLFSLVDLDDMDENEASECLQQDLPESHLREGKKKSPWLRTATGCDLVLMKVPADYNFSTNEELKAMLKQSPKLIQRGEGETAAYYLYAPVISLDEDKSEWTLIPIEEPQLSQRLRDEVDFSQERLDYSPNFDELYLFGGRHFLYMGSGSSSIRLMVNSFAGATDINVLNVSQDVIQENLVHVMEIYEEQKQSLTTHLTELSPKTPSPEC